MKAEHNKLNRRHFLKAMGAAGAGSIFALTKAEAGLKEPNAPSEEEPKYPQVPKRKLGKTGFEVPVLSHGMAYNLLENQVVLRAAVQRGVTYLDTANGYAGGNSELGIGKFISDNPGIREKLFIVTKATDAHNMADVESRLQTSLKRMNPNYIDLYYGVHGCDDPARLTDELRQWAEKAKERKLIRFFGFSTHSSVKVLMAASKLDWIDAVMTSYNFRLMQKPEMQEAVEACHKAGIGLIAMKIQGLQIETEDDKKLVKHFLAKGFTEGQAKVKVVLEDERFCAACITMQTVGRLAENVAAVLDQTKLSQADRKVLKDYAAATCSGYCAGCSDVCDSALPEGRYVSDVMRYLMYYNSYGEQDKAKRLFAQIPNGVRAKLLSTDYGPAEARCPQRLPIGKLITDAVRKLA